MTYSLGQLTLTPGTTQTFNAPNSGIAGIIIGNLSGYQLSINLEGSGVAKNLLPGTTDFFPYQFGFSGTIFVTTVNNLPNTLNYPGLVVTFDAVSLTENFNSSAYPVSNAAVQAVSPTASGKNAFTAQTFTTSTTQVNFALNIFNPSTSGIICTFYSAIAFTSATGTPRMKVTYKSGADLNLANAATVSSHLGEPNPPTSVVNATFAALASLTSGVDLDVLGMPTQIPVEALAFPDYYELFPGGNLYVAIVAAATGFQDYLTFKWSEGPSM